MSLLAPLYIAGLLAVALPVLFHLIRRTPEGRQDFSSLMFLAPSPPRITRRSRLSNLLLLLLRAAALSLLAFAFARPFLRQKADASAAQSTGRRVALLVDSSASMRRGDLWSQARQNAEQVVRGLAPGDELALYLFDRQVRPAVTFAEWNETDPSRRAALVAARLGESGPTWAPTRIGEALATAADLLAEAAAAQRPVDKTGRQLVLVSDMQQGGHVETLQGYQWPETVLLEVKPVTPKGATNASVQIVQDAPGAAEGADNNPAADGAMPDATPDGRLRVRVVNEPDSGGEQFSLAWADERGPLAGEPPLGVYVPPGRGQVVRVPWPAPGRRADRLVLSGDDGDFDNTLYLVPPRREAVRVLFVGDDAPGDAKGLLYYLQSAAADTPRRTVQFDARRPDAPLAEADLVGTRLAVVAAAVADERAAALRRFAEAGGDVLWVLKDAAAGPSLARVLGAEALEVAEAPPRDHALIARVDFTHPLFAPFTDARFSDFTKIHFWKHRRVKPADPASVRVLSSFDDGDPFLFEKTIGRGRLVVATSGWHPGDSQLALSTKFVPLVNGLLRRRDGAAVEAQYAVYDSIALPPAGAEAGARAVVRPGGGRTELAAAATTFDGTDEPGVYRLVQNGQETPLAVNLPPDESRTQPLAVEELEQWGARLGTKPPSDELVVRQRQLQTMELENRQKLWRWGILAVLGLLAAETTLAGRLARRAPEPQVTA